MGQQAPAFTRTNKNRWSDSTQSNQIASVHTCKRATDEDDDVCGPHLLLQVCLHLLYLGFE